MDSKKLIATIKKQCTPTQVFVLIGVAQTLLILWYMSAKGTRDNMKKPAVLQAFAMRYLSLAVLIVLTNSLCRAGWTKTSWVVVVLFVLSWGYIPTKEAVGKDMPNPDKDSTQSLVEVSDPTPEHRDSYAPPTQAQKMDPDDLLIVADQSNGQDPSAITQAPVGK